ncbi:preprotein translocase subunit SecE [endosymbiont of Sipalinus gigas]|uniref:preprotein translocase subunit SecE n=1 Tax=endosymbiont of Sipalinus gigas TaxID=1972134 RepID=UPI00102E90A0|nr:preprotein translocase subunit SecE [endosymbiont of Sipalinus gigas]
MIINKIILFISNIIYEIKDISYPSFSYIIYVSILLLFIILFMSLFIWMIDSILIFIIYLIIYNEKKL